MLVVSCSCGRPALRYRLNRAFSVAVILAGTFSCFAFNMLSDGDSINMIPSLVMISDAGLFLPPYARVVAVGMLYGTL